MPELTVYRGSERSKITFTAGQRLKDVLVENGLKVLHPCGGRGSCGKCAVQLNGCISAPNSTEKKFGKRLSCQAVLLGDAELILPMDTDFANIEFSDVRFVPVAPMPGKTGAVVDIGTTTIACRLFDLHSGKCLAETGMLNPQTEIAADVMGRIEAALKGASERLRLQITDAVHTLLRRVFTQCGQQFAEPDSMVVTGNTTMLYLLMGRNPEALSHAPFLADHLFDETIRAFSENTYLPPCMNAFVGADISCAILSSEMCVSDETALLADIGTNGEIALWKDGVLFVTSTAAGPAFEGAGISCGCGCIRGAIDRVWIEDGKLRAHTIDDAPACGVCGSGLIDAIAALLELGAIDETGATEKERMELRDGVALIPKDVRAVQLAKAAIAAGIETLMDMAEVKPEEINTFYIAGGFGSHLNISGAAAIGLIPAKLTGRVKVLGNAALTGASALLLDTGRLREIRAIVGSARFVNLGGNPAFNERYIDNICF